MCYIMLRCGFLGILAIGIYVKPEKFPLVHTLGLETQWTRYKLNILAPNQPPPSHIGHLSPPCGQAALCGSLAHDPHLLAPTHLSYFVNLQFWRSNHSRLLHSLLIPLTNLGAPISVYFESGNFCNWTLSTLAVSCYIPFCCVESKGSFLTLGVCSQWVLGVFLYFNCP